MNPLITAMAPLPLGIWWRAPRRQLTFPLAEPGCDLFARARHALWYGLRVAGLETDDEVLVPAFHHGSEVEALVRLGTRCRFYEATETLEPDEAELRRLLGRRTRALVLIHYLGFPQDAARWRRWCLEHGILLIEDAAQAWLADRDGRPVGSDGDVAVFCLYKMFGLPDGAALISRHPAARASSRPRVGLRGLAFEHALWLLTRSPTLTALAERASGRRRYSAELDFALGEPASAPSATSLAVLRRLSGPDAAQRRRRNYEELFRSLNDLVPPEFQRPLAGASPFVFPIAASDKSGMLARLRRGRVRALNLWSVPHPALRAEDFSRAAALRATVVGLPVHQELRPRDLRRIVDAVRAG